MLAAVVCALLVGGAVLLLVRPRASARSRLEIKRDVPGRRDREGRRLPARLAVVVGLTALVYCGVTGVGTGWIAALFAVVGAALVARAARTRRDVVSDVATSALAIDLVAACVESGASVQSAFAAGGVVNDTFDLASRLLARGDDESAWTTLESVDALRPVASACRRSMLTGAAIADELRRVAVRHRRDANLSARRRAHRAAVWVVLPLTLCFLPAFVLLTVVPIVIGLLPALR